MFPCSFLKDRRDGISRARTNSITFPCPEAKWEGRAALGATSHNHRQWHLFTAFEATMQLLQLHQILHNAVQDHGGKYLVIVDRGDRGDIVDRGDGGTTN